MYNQHKDECKLKTAYELLYKYRVIWDIINNKTHLTNQHKNSRNVIYPYLITFLHDKY